MPPEIVNKEKYIAQYSDVWSLGVLLYTMLYGRFPFRAKDDDTLFSLINEGKIIFPENIPVRESIKFLIKQIINVNPKIHIFFLSFIFRSIVIKNISIHIAHGLNPSTNPSTTASIGSDTVLALILPNTGTVFS